MVQLQSTDALPLMEMMLGQVVELEARLEKKEQEMERMRNEVVEARVREGVRAAMTPPEAVSGAQLSALQTRLEALYERKLLSDDEFFMLEDLCADVVELKSKVGVVTNETLLAFEPAAKLHTLMSLSETMKGDAAFVRQARRKLVAK
jgi:hypothetical protein